jgi:multimeric flavodoxin WrbA
MKVLGICCGGRPMGNSELLVKHALKHMRAAGASVRITRLQDWKIDQCKGCFGCVFKNRECHLADDLRAFIDFVFEYDRVLVAAPTYVLFPPGGVKVVLDRIGAFAHAVKTRESNVRYGAVLGLAGVAGWDHFTIPMMSMFLRVVTGYRAYVTDRLLLHHPGPGEALLCAKSMQRVETLADRLLQGTPAVVDETPAGSKECPLCGSKSFLIRSTDPLTIECPFCRSAGQQTPDGVIRWNPDTLFHHRFTREAGQEFVDEWILKSSPWYMRKFRDVALAKQDYKDANVNIQWETRQP